MYPYGFPECELRTQNSECGRWKEGGRCPPGAAAACSAVYAVTSTHAAVFGRLPSELLLSFCTE